MIPFPAGHHVLARAHRRRRVQRCNINFRNLTKLTRIVTKMVITRGLELFTHTTIEATSDAIIIAQQDDSHSRSVDAAAIELIIPFTLILRRRLRREVRELEASLVRMKDQYQACSVKIYSRDQMGVRSIFFFIFKLIIAFLYIL